MKYNNIGRFNLLCVDYFSGVFLTKLTENIVKFTKKKKETIIIYLRIKSIS